MEIKIDTNHYNPELTYGEKSVHLNKRNIIRGSPTEFHLYSDDVKSIGIFNSILEENIGETGLGKFSILVEDGEKITFYESKLQNIDINVESSSRAEVCNSYLHIAMNSVDITEKEKNPELSIEEYQEFTNETAVFPDEIPEFMDAGVAYCALGLVGEAGEVSEKVKKAIREEDEEYLDKAIDELGDVTWYASQFAEQLDEDMVDVMGKNMSKLQDRQERNKITGQGDDR